MQPDFSKYSKQELKDCLDAIDHQRYPERVAEIQNRLNSLYEKEQERISKIPLQERKQEQKRNRKGSLGFLLLWAGYCIYVLISGHIPSRFGDGVTLEENPILFFLFYGFFLYLLVFFIVLTYEHWFSKERA